MNLIYIIRKYLIIGIITVMFIGCLSHYMVFKYFFNESTDKILYDYKGMIENYVAETGTFNTYPVSMLKPSRIEKRIINNPAKHPEIVKDTLIYNSLSHKYNSFRQLYFNIYFNNNWHQVNINYPTIESDNLNLFRIIISSLLILFILLIFFTYFISFALKRNIWLPFYKNLKCLQNYDLKAKTVLNLDSLGIKEFDELNEAVMRMVKKIDEDYENFRIFLEDTSHEMQTPLSIMKSKLDLLIQNDCPKNEESINYINAISRAITRLSRINRSLLILTKINNDQFKDKKIINITYVIENYLNDFSELIQARKLSCQVKLETTYLWINRTLAEILVSNLLSNTIRHNIKGGVINIELTAQELIIENTCLPNPNSENLFSRLVYRSKSEDSTGLGLNIVKSICDKNNFIISYQYIQENIFQIKVIFSK